MTIRIAISLIVLLFAIQTGNSQAYGERELPLDLGFLSRLNETIRNSDEENGSYRLKGNSYYNEDWMPAVITDIHDRVHHLKVKYRIYHEQMEVLTESSEQLFILSPTQIRHIKLGAEDFYVFSYRNDEKVVETGYFQELVAGKISLYRRYKGKYSRGREIPALNKTIPPKVDIQKFIFARTEEKGIRQLELKEKNILAFMDGEERKKIKEFAGKNDLSFKDEDDVIKLISYYNGME